MKKTYIIASALLSLASASALAQDNTVRIGAVHININSESPDLTSNGPAFLTPQPAGITVGNANTVYFGYTRRLTEHFSLDVALGIPPKHEVMGRGTLAPYGVTATVKQRAPTVFINYNFGSAEDKFRPFVGIGMNYTQFFDANSTPVGDIATGGPTKIDLKESFGVAGQLGVTYKLDDRWSVCASFAGAKVKTDMTATTGSIQRMTTINFRPTVYSMSVGYSF